MPPCSMATASSHRRTRIVAAFAHEARQFPARIREQHALTKEIEDVVPWSWDQRQCRRGGSGAGMIAKSGGNGFS